MTNVGEETEQVNIVMNLCGLVMDFVVDICKSWLGLEV